MKKKKVKPWIIIFFSFLILFLLWLSLHGFIFGWLPSKTGWVYGPLAYVDSTISLIFAIYIIFILIKYLKKRK